MTPPDWVLLVGTCIGFIGAAKSIYLTYRDELNVIGPHASGSQRPPFRPVLSWIGACRRVYGTYPMRSVGRSLSTTRSVDVEPHRSDWSSLLSSRQSASVLPILASGLGSPGGIATEKTSRRHHTGWTSSPTHINGHDRSLSSGSGGHGRPCHCVRRAEYAEAKMVASPPRGPEMACMLLWLAARTVTGRTHVVEA